jgi:hypothetical protein
LDKYADSLKTVEEEVGIDEVTDKGITQERQTHLVGTHESTQSVGIHTPLSPYAEIRHEKEK